MNVFATTATQERLKYERYVNKVLKVDLERICGELDRTTSDLSDYMELERSIAQLRCSSTLKTMVDVGCNTYVQARIDADEHDDNSDLLLHVGMGYYLQLELENAQEFVRSRVNFLRDKLEALRTKSAHIKAHIKLLLLYMSELAGEQLENS